MVNVPGSVRIRSRSVGNVDNDRLLARLDHLRSIFVLPAFGFDGRAEFGERVREAINIERELARRGVAFVPVTDGRHLVAVDIFDFPVVGPRPSGRAKRRAEGEVLLSAADGLH